MPTPIVMFRMEPVLKAFAKNGQCAKFTPKGNYRILLLKDPRPGEAGDFVVQIFKLTDGKNNPVKNSEPELSLRYPLLSRAIAVANQALQGGLDTLLMFHKPPLEM